MPPLDEKLMSMLFGETPAKTEPIKEKVIASPSLSPLQAQNMKPCDLETFMMCICKTYGMGLMDEVYEQDSPSWVQVWFYEDEALQLLNSKGYLLTKEQTHQYILQLMRMRLLDERDNLLRQCKEYRRRDFLAESIQKIRRQKH